MINCKAQITNNYKKYIKDILEEKNILYFHLIEGYNNTVFNYITYNIIP